MKKLIRITTIPLSLEKLLEGQLTYMNQYYEVTAVAAEKERLEKYGEKNKVNTFWVEMTRAITPVQDIKAVWKLYNFFKKEKPEIVQAVVDTVLEGWATAFASPRDAVAVCMAMGTNLDGPGQTMQMADIRALTFCNGTLKQGLGFPDPKHMTRAATALRDIGETVADGLEETMLEPRFWHAAPDIYKVRQ